MSVELITMENITEEKIMEQQNVTGMEANRVMQNITDQNNAKNDQDIEEEQNITEEQDIMVENNIPREKNAIEEDDDEDDDDEEEEEDEDSDDSESEPDPPDQSQMAYENYDESETANEEQNWPMHERCVHGEINEICIPLDRNDVYFRIAQPYELRPLSKYFFREWSEVAHLFMPPIEALSPFGYPFPKGG